jgi:hypothetical protein
MTAIENQWISFFEEQPVDGQDIYYYGQHIGVWSGQYRYDPNDPVSHHIILCGESYGVVDRMDAPWWMPDNGQDKPQKPSRPVPPDYPSG